MGRYRKWALTLGILAVTPGIAVAGPFSFLSGKSGKSTQGASARDTATKAVSKSKSKNQRIAEEIAALLRAERLTGYDIEVSYKNGVAHLSGQIGSELQKAKATEAAYRIAAVKRVDNQLRPIRRQAKAARRSATGGMRARVTQIRQTSSEVPQTPTVPNNQRVANRVAAALSKASLNGYEIEIRVDNGKALLSGMVATADQRTRAAQIAGNIAGVNSVDNRLGVLQQQITQESGPQFQGAGFESFAPPISAAAYQPRPNGAPMAGAAPYGHPGPGASQAVYNNTNLPEYAWPSYASYPNSAQIAYPKQYSASAWPYIGPFYPYPQIPLGWRQASLEWDDGYWQLNFRPRTDRWWWFMNPKNW